MKNLHKKSRDVSSRAQAYTVGALTLWDNHRGRNHSVNTIETTLGKQIRKVKKEIGELDTNLGEKIRNVEKTIEDVDEKLGVTRLSILIELQEAMFRTMKAIDGKKDQFREYVKRVEECRKRNYEGPRCLKGKKKVEEAR